MMQNEFVDDIVIDNNLSDKQKCNIKQIFYNFSIIFSDVPSKTDCIEQKIELISDKTVKLKPYPSHLTSQQTVKEEVDSMLKSDIICHSTLSYGSPIVLVKKKRGSTRFCIDFSRINSLTVYDAAPIPDVGLIFTKLYKAKYFTEVYMTKGYWQYSAFQADLGL